MLFFIDRGPITELNSIPGRISVWNCYTLISVLIIKRDVNVPIRIILHTELLLFQYKINKETWYYIAIKGLRKLICNLP